MKELLLFCDELGRGVRIANECIMFLSIIIMTNIY